MATLQERVDRGETFLDTTIPDWRKLINLETLDLGDPELCVIGQTFCHKLRRDSMGEPTGSPWTAGTWAAHDFEDEHQLLFEDDDVWGLTVGYGFERDFESYDDLRDEWLKRIQKTS